MVYRLGVGCQFLRVVVRGSYFYHPSYYKVFNSNIDKSIINSIKIAIQKSSPLPIPINKYNLFKKFILEFDLSFPITK